MESCWPCSLDLQWSPKGSRLTLNICIKATLFYGHCHTFIASTWQFKLCKCPSSYKGHFPMWVKDAKAWEKEKRSRLHLIIQVFNFLHSGTIAFNIHTKHLDKYVPLVPTKYNFLGQCAKLPTIYVGVQASKRVGGDEGCIWPDILGTSWDQQYYQHSGTCLRLGWQLCVAMSQPNDSTSHVHYGFLLKACLSCLGTEMTLYAKQNSPACHCLACIP